jgi:hypothetical protein
MTSAVATVPAVTDPRELALLKAVGLDRLAPEQRELALNIAGRYDLDLMLKHLVMIEGRPYITRDGLLHIAHRSGVFDGIEVTDPVVVDEYWRCTASVYRKDFGRPVTYPGRYPTKGGNQKFAPEMAIKVAESMALRRAFNVAAPTQDERWDVPEADAVPIQQAPKPSLVERVAAKAAEVAADTTPTPDAALGASEAVVDPVAEGQEDFELLDEDRAPDTDRLTVEQFREMANQHKIAPQYARDVARQMWPEIKATIDLTDQQRAELMAELLK